MRCAPRASNGPNHLGLSSGQLGGAAVQPWKPWWEAPPPVIAGLRAEAAGERPTIVEVEGEGPAADEAAEVEEVGEVDEEEEEEEEGEGVAEGQWAAAPPLPQEGSLPPLSSLLACGRAPAPSLRYHLAELLYAYAYAKLL